MRQLLAKLIRERKYFSALHLIQNTKLVHIFSNFSRQNRSVTQTKLITSIIIRDIIRFLIHWRSSIRIIIVSINLKNLFMLHVSLLVVHFHLDKLKTTSPLDKLTHHVHFDLIQFQFVSKSKYYAFGKFVFEYILLAQLNKKKLLLLFLLNVYYCTHYIIHDVEK